MKYLITITLLFSSNIAHSSDPSFDCKLASTNSEKEICSYSNLATLDREIAKIYAHGIKILSTQKKDALRQSQRAWLKGREKPFPNLSSYMEKRIRVLHTFITSPDLKLPAPPTENKFIFEFHDEVEEEFLSDSLIGYLNHIAGNFLIEGGKLADRYVDMSVEEFNKIKPMAVYFGPARLYGVESSGKKHCYHFWELYISLGAKWRYLREYFDSNGHKVEMPDSSVSEADLHKCEEFDGKLKMVFWMNSEQASRSGEVGSMQLKNYVYDSTEYRLIEI